MNLGIHTRLPLIFTILSAIFLAAVPDDEVLPRKYWAGESGFILLIGEQLPPLTNIPIYLFVGFFSFGGLASVFFSFH